MIEKAEIKKKEEAARVIAQEEMQLKESDNESKNESRFKKGNKD